MPTSLWPKRVLEEEPAINELQIEIDDRVVQLLALQQLMAVDLRFVLAVSRINNDLERIGDQAVNIAQSALRILRHPRVKPYVDLPRMSEMAEGMVRDSLNAWSAATSNWPAACCSATIRWISLRDQIFRELLSYMMGDSAVVFPGVRADPGGQESRARRRSCHQHRRGRHLHGRRPRRTPRAARTAAKPHALSPSAEARSEFCHPGHSTVDLLAERPHGGLRRR